jgi:hypothetical protein
MISALLDHLMADDATDAEKVVFILSEWTAGTWIYFSILDFVAGKIKTGTLYAALAVCFAILGVKWPYVKAKIGLRLASFVERIARKYRGAIYCVIVIALLVSVGVQIYRHYQNGTKEHQAPEPTSKGPVSYSADSPLGGWMAGWGAAEPQSDGSLMIRSAVRTETLFPIRDHIRVMLVYRVSDNRVDEMNDREIIKSAIFTVNNTDPLVIDTPIEPSILARRTPRREGPILLEMEVVLAILPPSVTPDKISKLADVAKNGGSLLSKGGFGITGRNKRLPRKSK